MAVSVPVLTIPSLDSGRGSSNRLAAPSCSSKLSSSTSLQFPLRTQKFRVGNTGVCSPARPRVLPLVKAKKQSFSSFDDLLANSDKPVLVDFYATWCGPCQFMGPVLNEVSARLQDKIQVVKIDTEKYPSSADKFRIEALPTFILFRDGEPYDRFEGALTADQLVQRIENSLKVKQ
ncbi:thioredoxin Y1, chloroplastic-like [Juglans microcarpa x Juglans regia]|uniref:thioredoxin Y1, chloroplastic-like n=1 Tax=Juglans microcarpa x Juglans regia TaxID=2249226 RepID=UPI001B7E0DB6|nr:thioredoxin Y1, chloroplastic-like [Juglans microcarpa x Juglans regia]XP_040997841.1 thioredoxin Y1, chloroplastic-like [Juglans microcarpa x Juglans regia]